MARQYGLKGLKVTLTAAGTAQQVSSTAIYASGVEIYVPSSNTGANMYVGGSDVDSTFRPIPKQQYFSLPDTSKMGTSGRYDLREIYFDGDTTNDIIIVTYTIETQAE